MIDDKKKVKERAEALASIELIAKALAMKPLPKVEVDNVNTIHAATLTPPPHDQAYELVKIHLNHAVTSALLEARRDLEEVVAGKCSFGDVINIRLQILSGQ